ncbi:MAG: hypothetical protein KatS3mg053_3308 [Candidatus Roseilinea sp.]|nr:MAG: hypothetical protein KatS3mg053_3308 [Candidatus Roseilinea sp.]
MSTGIKRRAVHALLTLGVLMHAACAGVQPRRVIIVWHTLSDARERSFLRLVDRWNQTNGDGIVVIPERREPAAQHRALLEGAATGLLPDLALVQPAEAALYAQRGLLAPLDRFIGSDDVTMSWDAGDQADLFPFVQQAGRTPQGQLLGVPFGGDMQIVLSNRDWMNSLGQSEMPAEWEAFGKACESATDRIAGTACFGFNPNDPSAEDWLYAHGAPLYDPTTQQVQIASPGVASAIETLLNYLQSGRAYRAISSERSRDDFAAARVLFAFTSTDRLRDFTQTVRERSNFGLDVGTLPSAAPVASIHAPLWVIPKRTDDRERAAWKFIHWLLETEQTAQWAAGTEEMPARISALVAMELDPEQPLDALRIKALQRIAPVARPAPLLSGWPCVQAELSNAIRQIIEGQPLEDALVLAQTRAQALLNADCVLR